MPRRYTEMYWIRPGRHGEMILSWEEDWHVEEKPITSLLEALQLARQRSLRWVILLMDEHGMEIRRLTPESYLQVVQGNPFYLSIKPEGKEIHRMGPMSEADFWIEDLEEGLKPLHTGADPTYEDVGELLRQRRLELGLSLRDVADMADMPTSTLFDIERGKTRSQRTTLKHLAKILAAYFEGPLPSRRKSNPGVDFDVFEEIDEDHYRMFHGVSPSEVIEKQGAWVPGGMVFIGVGKDVGYGISNPDSFKDGWYVHDFGSGVKIYRRPRSGEKPDRTWRSFPSQLTNLGWNLGFSYTDSGPDGALKEVKGSQSKHLAVTPNRKTLVVIDGVGVLYLMEGGAMRVDDWIRD